MRKFTLSAFLLFFVFSPLVSMAASISLNGGAEMGVLQGRQWSDPGGVVFDSSAGSGDWDDVDISGDVVDTSADSGTVFSLTYTYINPSDPSIKALKVRLVSIEPSAGVNQKPTISTRSEATVPEGTAYDPKASALCSDAEDGIIANLSSSAQISKNTLPDTYDITLSCVDSQGLAADPKTVSVTVSPSGSVVRTPDDTSQNNISDASKNGPAGDPGGLVPCSGLDCNFCSLVTMVNRIVTLLFEVMVVIAVILIAIAGFKLVTSAGNVAAMESAKKMITNAMIGFVIVLSAWLIVDTVMKVMVTGEAFDAESWNRFQNDCGGIKVKDLPEGAGDWEGDDVGI